MTKALLCLPSVSYSVVKDRRATDAGGAGYGAPAARRPSPVAHGGKIYRGHRGRAADDPLSNLVEIAGLEPAASGLQSRRSPS